MKLAGCVWSFLPTPETTPHWDELTGILDDIRSIGFEGVDFLATDESLTEFYSEDCCRRLGSYARSIGLEPNVMVYQAAEKFSDPRSEIREKLERGFEQTARAASLIGCGIVSTLAHRPYGAVPWRLNPRACAQKEAFHLPDDYDYRADWERLCQAYRRCCATAEKFGLRCSIEGHIFSMVSTPQAMLDMLRAVGSDNFGIQLDTNHLVAQRIDPEFAIHMLGGKSIFNVHCKDHDMYSRGNIPAGCGVTDFTEVIRALRAVGYDGNLTVELEFTDNPVRYNRQAYEHIVKCLAGDY